VTPVAPGLVGVAVLTRRRGPLAELLAGFPTLAPRLADEHLSRTRGAGPLRQRSSRRVQGRVLLVGDAAGYVDALTGEGIAVGLEHGPLAARAITQALAAGDFDFSGYSRAVAGAVVGRELTLDGRLARMLYASRAFPLWLSLIMFDERVQQLYAARVSGSEVLADRKGALLAALGRHALAAPRRLRRLTSPIPSAA
jgi:flavin-dependent dehydrogenase